MHAAEEEKEQKIWRLFRKRSWGREEEIRHSTYLAHLLGGGAGWLSDSLVKLRCGCDATAKRYLDGDRKGLVVRRRRLESYHCRSRVLQMEFNEAF